MKITYNEAKSAMNIQERGLSFEVTHALDWEAAIFWQDTRKDYKEERWCALLPHGETHRLHAVVFTLRGQTMRIISLRKANKRERKSYDQKTRH